MSLIKNEFFEKKITHLLQMYPYVLIFHYNNITSKEWLDLKKKLFQINPFIINKVIPNRFLSQLWKNLKFEDKYVKNDTYNFQNLPKAIITLELSKSQITPGSSCLFFCSTMEDLKNIFRIIENPSQTRPSWGKPADLRLTSNNLKFINIGMISINLKNIDLKHNFFNSITREAIENNERAPRGTMIPSLVGGKEESPSLPRSNPPKSLENEVPFYPATFFNPYDIQKMLGLDFHIFQKLSESLNRNEYLITHFHKFLNFSTPGKIFNFPRMIFNIHHYDLLNILSIRSSQMLKANNGN